MKTQKKLARKTHLLCGQHINANSDNCTDLARHTITEYEANQLKTQHTPTPWAVNGIENKRYRIDSLSTERVGIDFLANPIGHILKEEDAAFIVRAVNSHEALIKVAELASDLPCVKPDSCLHCDAIQAIAQAEGGK